MSPQQRHSPPVPLPPPQLPTSMAELILATVPQVITGTTEAASPDDQVHFAQVLPVLPHHAAPSVLKAILVMTNTSPDLTGWPRLFNVNRLLVSLTESAGSFAGESPLAWYLTQLVPLAIRCPRFFGRALVWAICTGAHVAVMECLLEQPSTYGLLFNQAELILCHVSQAGRVDILDHLKDRDFPMEYTEGVAERAGMSGSVNMLDWWHRFRLERGLQSTESGPPTEEELWFAAVTSNAAFRCGHAQVLEWIHNKYAGVFANDPFLWSHVASWIDASCMGHVRILEWASGHLPIPTEWPDCNKLPMDNVDLGVLEFWYARLVGDGEALLPYSHRALENASKAGRLDILEWWSNSSLPLAFTPAVVQMAMDYGHAHVVQWWHSCDVYKAVACGGLSDARGLASIPKHPITLAAFGRLDMLVDFRESIVAIMPASLLLEVRRVAAEYGHIEVLEAYWDVFVSAAASNDAEFPWDGIAMTAASIGQLNILKWWIAREFQLDALMDEVNDDHYAIMWQHLAHAALDNDQAHVLEWLLTSSHVKRVLIENAWQRHHIDQVQLMVQEACRSGRRKCLQLMYMLGMVWPTMMTAEQVEESCMKEWWEEHMTPDDDDEGH